MEPGCCRILVVDDEPFIRSLVQASIEAMGHEVKQAQDGQAALEAMRAEPADLVVTDLLMPRMSGLELTRAVRGGWPDVPVVVITGFASLESALAAMHEGVYDYLTKPFQIDELRLTVRNALERVTLVRENRRLMDELADAARRLADAKAARAESETNPPSSEPRRIANGMDRLRAVQNRLLPLHYASPGAGGEVVDMLSALDGLRDRGTLTAPEFQDLKRRVLEGR